MVEVTVDRLGIDSTSNSYVVILRERGGGRWLPIWIGQPEAESIAIEMNHLKMPRPLTHDLCKRLITGMGGTLHRIQITRVQDRTYYAELHIRRGDDVVHVDARPSDSIAIALRCAAPIFAQEMLLTTAPTEEGEQTEEGEEPAVSQSQAEAEERRLRGEQLKAYLERMRPEDFGKFNP